MPVCAVIGCRDENNTDLPRSFHRFPISDPQMIKKWLTNTKLNWICSNHFEERFLDRSSGVVRLTSDAVPTIFDVPDPDEGEISESSSSLDGDQDEENDVSDPSNLSDVKIEDMNYTSEENTISSFFRPIFAGRLKQLKDENFLCDVTLTSKTKKQFQAHKIILAACSLLFEQIFKASRKVNMECVHLPMLDDFVLKAMLQYMYTGKLLLPPEYADDDKRSELLLLLTNLGLDADKLRRAVKIDRKNKAGSEISDEDSCFDDRTRDVFSATDADSNAQPESGLQSLQNHSFDLESSQDFQNTTNSSLYSPMESSTKNDEHNYHLLSKRASAEGNGTASSSGGDDETAFSNDLEEYEELECAICRCTFESNDDLLNHGCVAEIKLEASTDLNDFDVIERIKKPKKNMRDIVCHLCGAKMKLYSLKSHMESQHEKMQRYKCKECERTFDTESKRYKHSRKVHWSVLDGTGKEYMCDICGKCCTDSVALYHHSYSHRSNKTRERNRSKKCPSAIPSINTCPHCGKVLKYKYALDNHIRKSHGVGKDLQFECPECDKRFLFKSTLEQHRATHRSERPFPCDICTKSFKTKNSYQIHVRQTHTERRYVCSLCGDKFKQSHHLAQHMVHHSDERLFQCDLCDKSYKVKHDLKLHYRRVHNLDYNLHYKSFTTELQEVINLQ